MSIGQNLYTGNLTNAEKIMAYNALVEEGFQAPFDRPQDLQYTKIAMVKTAGDMGIPGGVIPNKVSFGFSPPNGQATLLGENGRIARPISAHSIEVSSQIWTDTLYAERQTFEADVMGILKKIPRDLRRTEAKNPDKLLAVLLRNGKTSKDYRGENFFATGKKCSPEGAIADTFDNLYTGLGGLTEVNLASVCQKMMNIKAADGLNLGVRPTTLVVPFSLYHDAVVATQMTRIVFAGTGNAAPGQTTTNGSAAADNPMAIALKWIKEIVVLDTLQDGQAINDTTWYVLDASQGPTSLLYAQFAPAEYASLMDPRDANVFFNEKFYWGWRKAEGVAYGLPQYIARCEA